MITKSEFMRNKPEGMDIHELYDAFSDIDMREIQDVIAKFKKMNRLCNTQGGERPWWFTLRR